MNIEQLPKELKTATFMQLLSIRSTYALAATSRSFNAIFEDQKPQILRQALLNEIPRHLLDDVLTLYEAKSANRTQWTRERIDEFFDGYNDRTTRFISGRSQLSQLTELIRFHGIVVQLSQEMADQALISATQRMSLGTMNSQPTIAEKCRFQDAFYRLEMFFTFFGDKKQRQLSQVSQYREAFWNRFAAWEIEQIASVYEFLYGRMSNGGSSHRILSTSFHLINLTALLDVAMRNSDFLFMVWQSEELDDDMIDCLPQRLACGLDYIHTVITGSIGDTAEDEFKFLRGYDYDSDLDSIEKSLSHIAAVQPIYKSHTLESLEEYNPFFAKDFVRPPFFPGQDHRGPKMAWRWAYWRQRIGDLDRVGLAFAPCQACLRRIAYVFWDPERLEDWKILDKPWTGSFEQGWRDRSIEYIRDISQKLEARRIEILKEEDDASD